MTDRHDHDRDDHRDRLDTAAAWVLGALPGDQAAEYARHLEGCERCRAEVAALQPVVDVLPLAAPRAQPSPSLRARVMAEVRREADLLAAAGPEADRPARDEPREGGGWWSRLLSRPAWAAAGAAAVLAVGVLAGVLATAGDDAPPQLRAAVTAVDGGARHGVLVQQGDRAELLVRGVPAPPEGRVYQAWVVRGGRPVADAVFTVDRQGDGSVVLEGDVAAAEEVLVTHEPTGGSATPTSEPLLGAAPS